MESFNEEPVSFIDSINYWRKIQSNEVYKIPWNEELRYVYKGYSRSKWRVSRNFHVINLNANKLDWVENFTHLQVSQMKLEWKLETIDLLMKDNEVE